MHQKSHQLMQSWELTMRTTVTLDEDLVEVAQELTGATQRSTLFRTALVALIERESARRLALRGGSEPDFRPVHRRRSQPA